MCLLIQAVYEMSVIKPIHVRASQAAAELQMLHIVLCTVLLGLFLKYNSTHLFQRLISRVSSRRQPLIQQVELFTQKYTRGYSHTFKKMKDVKKGRYLIGLNFRHMGFPHLSFPRDCHLQKERQPLALHGSRKLHGDPWICLPPSWIQLPAKAKKAQR